MVREKKLGLHQQPQIAALSGSHSKAPGFAGGYLLCNHLPWPQFCYVGEQKEAGMYKFVHEQNLLRFQRLLDETADEVRRRLLSSLMAEEQAKDWLQPRPH